MSNRNAAALQTMGLSGLLATGLVLAWTSLKVPLICPLRALTTVPCPLCGMTTGTVAFLRGDLSGALAAAPASIAVVPATVAGISVAIWNFIKGSKPRWASTRLRQAGVVIGGLTLIFSWVFQLHRFDVI